MTDILTVSEFGLILVVATLSYLVAGKLKLHKLPIYVIAGLLFGLVLPRENIEYMANANQYLVLTTGIVSYIFGTRVSVTKIKSLHIGIIGTVALAFLILALGFLILPLAGIEDFGILFFAAIISISSFPVSRMILEHHVQHDQELGELNTAMMSAQYLLVIPAFMLLATIGTANPLGLDFATPIIGSIVFLALIIASGIYLVPYLNKWISTEGNIKIDHSSQILAVLISGLFLLLAGVLSVPLVFAAFAVGLSVSDLIKSTGDKSDLGYLTELALAILIILLTSLINIQDINYSLFLVIMLVMIPLKVLFSTVINIWFGFTIIDSLGASLAQSQIGEGAYILALTGVAAGWFSDATAINTLLAAIVTGILLSPFIYVNVDWLHDQIESNMRRLSPNLHRGFFLNTSRKSIVKSHRDSEL